MDWYIVTKLINGTPYHYRQRTRRIDGRVRTESVYLGRADAVGRRVASRARQPAATAAVMAAAPPPVLPPNNTPPASNGVVLKTVVLNELAATGVRRVFLVHTAGISSYGGKFIARASQKLARQLEDLGVIESDSSFIELGVGWRFRIRTLLLGTARSIVLPTITAPSQARRHRDERTSFYNAAAIFTLQRARVSNPQVWRQARDAFTWHRDMRDTLAAAMRLGKTRSDTAAALAVSRSRAHHHAATTRLRKLSWRQRLLSKQGQRAKATLTKWRDRHRAARHAQIRLARLAPFLTRW
jgi:hypothetical protein